MSAAGVVAYVGLGSNLEDPLRQVRQAFDELDALPQTRLLQRSPLYRSVPHGPAEQPDYVNAVAMLETRLEPQALLDELHRIERRHGRVRAVHWGPRTLDLDLLLYADRRIDSQHLTVPHPQMHRRAFVLAPLHDIAPDLRLPGLGLLAERLHEVDTSDLQVLAESGRD